MKTLLVLLIALLWESSAFAEVMTYASGDVTMLVYAGETVVNLPEAKTFNGKCLVIQNVSARPLTIVNLPQYPHFMLVKYQIVEFVQDRGAWALYVDVLDRTQKPCAN